MRQRNFLSSDELRLIKSQQDRPLEAARTLLKVLKDKSDAAWTCFAHCLLDTGETESDSAFCEEGKSDSIMYCRMLTAWIDSRLLNFFSVFAPFRCSV